MSSESMRDAESMKARLLLVNGFNLVMISVNILSPLHLVKE